MKRLKIMFCSLFYYYNRSSYELLHLVPSLKSLGHDVKMFPLVENNKIFNVDSKFIDTCLIMKPDLIMIRPYMDILSPEAIKYISNYHKTVALFGDDEKYFINGHYSSSELAGSFTHITTSFKPAATAAGRSGGR